VRENGFRFCAENEFDGGVERGEIEIEVLAHPERPSAWRLLRAWDWKNRVWKIVGPSTAIQ